MGTAPSVGMDMVTEVALASASTKVELAASEIFGIPGMARIYHTSVVLDGEEYFFSQSGIWYNRTMQSHEEIKEEPKIIRLGYSNRTGAQLLRALYDHFREGTYSTLSKNCNTFSDCALYYLLRMRLERKYYTVDAGCRDSVGFLNKAAACRTTFSCEETADRNEADKIVESLGGGLERKEDPWLAVLLNTSTCEPRFEI